MQAAVVTAAFSVVRRNLFLDDAVKTARIKEGSVELHSMHCSMHCSVQVQKDTDTKNCSKCELDYECKVVAAGLPQKKRTHLPKVQFEEGPLLPHVHPLAGRRMERVEP